MALAVLVTLERLHGERLVYRTERAFGRTWGTLSVRKALRRGDGVEAIEARWAAELADFERRRAPHLLYR